MKFGKTSSILSKKINNKLVYNKKYLKTEKNLFIRLLMY